MTIEAGILVAIVSFGVIFTLLGSAVVIVLMAINAHLEELTLALDPAEGMSRSVQSLEQKGRS
jgi:hypothetical protein